MVVPVKKKKGDRPQGESRDKRDEEFYDEIGEQ